MGFEPNHVQVVEGNVIAVIKIDDFNHERTRKKFHRNLKKKKNLCSNFLSLEIFSYFHHFVFMTNTQKKN